MTISYERHEHQMTVFPYENLVFNRHLHKEVELIFLHEGELQINIENRQKVLSAGDAAIIFPNLMHSYISEKHNNGVLIVFSAQTAADHENILTSYACNSPFIKREAISPDILMCINYLTTQNHTQNTALLKGYTTVLIGNLFNIVNPQKKQYSEKHQSLNIVLHYVTNHYLEALTLDQIAAHTGISRYTVSRIFNHELQCGIKEYVNSLRIGYAQHLLCNHDLPITEIAYESGFSSLRTFNRVFAKMMGESPRSYRKRL